MGPHLVIPSLEGTPNPEVVDYSEAGSKASGAAELSDESAQESQQETKKFGRLLNLIEAAKKRKQKKKGPYIDAKHVLNLYRRAATQYQGPRRGTTCDEEA